MFEKIESNNQYEIEPKLPENIEGDLSFEWGPELGRMSWDEAQEKITELNNSLKEGEESWRLPAKEEWDQVLKPFTVAKGKGVSGKKLEEILEDIRKNNNLEPVHYWSSSTYIEDPKAAWVVDMFDGNAGYGDKAYDLYLVRCRR